MTGVEIRVTLLDQLAASRNCTRDELDRDGVENDVIDSLEGVELLIKAEEIYGIAIPDDDITSEVCSAIDKLVEVIQSKIRAGQP